MLNVVRSSKKRAERERELETYRPRNKYLVSAQVVFSSHPRGNENIPTVPLHEPDTWPLANVSGPQEAALKKVF